MMGKTKEISLPLYKQQAGTAEKSVSIHIPSGSRGMFTPRNNQSAKYTEPSLHLSPLLYKNTFVAMPYM